MFEGPMRSVNGTLLAVVVVAIIFFVIGMVGSVEESGPNPTDRYCEMVEVHMETDGEYGWPDYDDMYEYCD